LEGLPQGFDPKRIEEEVRALRDEIRRIVEERRKDAEEIGFVEGPPTLNGRPHMGHIRGRVLKDIWYRFNTMKGKRVVFRAGWDTQGLPVELEAEKELGLTGSKYENLKLIGEEKLVEACQELIKKYYRSWREADSLLGMSFDYEHEYMTYRDDYIEREWRYLKRALELGVLEEGYRVVAYCPSCQTSLSHAEVSQSYEMVEDPSLYYKVKLKVYWFLIIPGRHRHVPYSVIINVLSTPISQATLDFILQVTVLAAIKMVITGLPVV